MTTCSSGQRPLQRWERASEAPLGGMGGVGQGGVGRRRMGRARAHRGGTDCPYNDGGGGRRPVGST